ncbi:MAG: YbaK/EbsC family protein, partial [Candidatus Nanohaloarchaea archaeon]|nr:YbaK/EbsC family protein [Candidatus Nanohaloarchaea archaeon]
APDDRVEELTGFEPGTVHPFASDLPLVVDPAVLEQDRVSFTTGDPERGIVMDVEAFREALKTCEYRVEEIARSPDAEYEKYAERYGISV